MWISLQSLQWLVCKPPDNKHPSSWFLARYLKKRIKWILNKENTPKHSNRGSSAKMGNWIDQFLPLYPLLSYLLQSVQASSRNTSQDAKKKYLLFVFEDLKKEIQMKNSEKKMSARDQVFLGASWLRMQPLLHYLRHFTSR